MWSINLHYNSLKLTPTAIQKLFDSNPDFYYDDISAVVDNDSYIYFEPDHMEHMDFLWDENVQNVICETKCDGVVIFGSAEGDNKGEFWGYRFVGGKFEEIDKKEALIFIANNESPSKQ